MPDVYASTVQPMKIGGKELPTASRRLSGGWDFQRSAPVYRPGQSTAGTGRQAFGFQLDVPLFGGMDEVNFPADYEELLFMLTDSDREGVFEYVDPILGPYNVRVSSWEVTDTAMERGGGRFNITLEENDDSDALLRFTLDPQDSASEGAAKATAIQADEELEFAGVDDKALDAAFLKAGVPRVGAEVAWPAGEFLAYQAAAAFDAINRVSVEADEAANQASRLRSRVNAIVALPAVQDPERWHIIVSLRRLSDFVNRALERSTQVGSGLVEFVTDGVVDVYSLSVALYGNSSRSSEILAVNPVPTPLAIPARTTLLVPAL